MTKPATPFHTGEIAVQTRVGVAQEVDAAFGSGFIRDHMPDQHRMFFEQLQFITLGMLDHDGRPWAMPVWSNEYFTTSPDPINLCVDTKLPFAKALNLNLRDHAKVGVLGIEPATRRRNRMNGTLSNADTNGLTIKVDQSFGNCPQYIQRRNLTLVDPDTITSPERSTKITAQARNIVDAADTFFIASRTAVLDNDPRSGVDASHRGGRPGFAHLDSEGVLSFPDFVGNRFFNTLGNIEADGRVGLCFPDWSTGDILFVTGRAQIIWDQKRIDAFVGAERLVEVQIEDSLLAEKAFAIKSDLIEEWPILELTGTYEEAKANVLRHDGYRSFMVDARMRESDVITSFYLEPWDGGPVEPHIAGQFLPVRLNGDILRSYTISQAPTGKGYRISVKREDEGQASQFLHDKVQVGDVIEVGKPIGDFTLDASNGPVVFLSAGVGITPMIAMLDGLVQEVGNGAQPRNVWFIHAAMNGKTHAFAQYLKDLATQYDWLKPYVSYSNPEDSDVLGQTHDSEEFLSINTLKQLLPFNAHHFYLCGPEGFMRTFYKGLRDTGIDPSHIHYEFFGQGDLGDETPAAETASIPNTAPVRFDKASKDATWTPESGTLLELAETSGLSPKFNCRKGNCGTCATRILSGNVAYDKKPALTPEPGQALICCARPADEDGVTLDI